MKAFPVRTDHDVQAFHEVPEAIQGADPHWTPNLGHDVERIFDPKVNSLLAEGDCARWILLDDRNQIAGRIAAYHNGADQGLRGGWGFFECVEDQRAAQTLLDAAMTWLGAAGCQTAEGPVNFGEKDRFHGALASGFDSPTVYLDPHNPPYYIDLIEGYGMACKDRITTSRVVAADVDLEQMKKALTLQPLPKGLTVRAADLQDLDGLAQALHSVYKAAFAEQRRLRHVTVDDVRGFLQRAKPLIDPGALQLAWLGDRPVGVWGFIRDLNHGLRKAVRPGLVEPLKFKATVFGILPEFQDCGVGLAMCVAFHSTMIAQFPGCEYHVAGVNAQSGAVLEFVRQAGGHPIKTHHTYTFTLKPNET